MTFAIRRLTPPQRLTFRFRNFCQMFEGFGFGKFGIGKEVSVSVSEKFGNGKKSRYRFRNIWYRKKSLGINFGKFGIGKKVLVSVSENLVSEKKSRYRFRKIWYRKKSLGIGFGQNFGIIIQW